VADPRVVQVLDPLEDLLEEFLSVTLAVGPGVGDLVQDLGTIDLLHHLVNDRLKLIDKNFLRFNNINVGELA
jgi:hypothetical protein